MRNRIVRLPLHPIRQTFCRVGQVERNEITAGHRFVDFLARLVAEFRLKQLPQPAFHSLNLPRLGFYQQPLPIDVGGIPAECRSLDEVTLCRSELSSATLRASQ